MLCYDGLAIGPDRAIRKKVEISRSAPASIANELQLVHSLAMQTALRAARYLAIWATVVVVVSQMQRRLQLLALPLPPPRPPRPPLFL